MSFLCVYHYPQNVNKVFTSLYIDNILQNDTK